MKVQTDLNYCKKVHDKISKVMPIRVLIIKQLVKIQQNDHMKYNIFDDRYTQSECNVVAAFNSTQKLE